jgi:hypothetical protein
MAAYREVEIRASMGGKSGEDVDILLTALVPDAQSGGFKKISAVIEVKGCWHPDLNSAMKSQLSDRYLTDSGIDDGIYLVGWFACPQWDRSDGRQGKTPNISIEEARRQLEEQAAGLSSRGKLIRAVVLNTALR